MQYRPRVVDASIRAALRAAPAVVVEGPKACGKTVSAQQVCASEVRLDVDDNSRQLALLDPTLLLEGARPRLIDEWQEVPALWNHVRRAADAAGSPGQFILTGSASPADDITRHTGAGRFLYVRMRPMSLFEMGSSSGRISLAQALRAGIVSQPDDCPWALGEMTAALCGGGWPAMQAQGVGERMLLLRGYVHAVAKADILRVDAVRRDPVRVENVMRSLARHTSTTASLATIAGDVPDADRDTVRDYVQALERLMVIEDLPAWAPHLRSRARLRRSSKRHFVDPALAVAALGASPQQLLKDLNFLGLLFESLVVRDIRVYCASFEGAVSYYADHSGHEVDVVVQDRAGRWAALEVKLGTGRADEGAASLHRFLENVDVSRVGPPAFMAVVVPGGRVFVRADGIVVLPLNALGP